MFRRLIVPFALVLVAGCGSSNASAPKETTTYTDKTSAVTVEYPKEWGATQEIKGGFVVYMDSEKNSFRRNVNVIKQVDGQNLDDIVKASDSDLRTRGGEVLDTKPVTVDSQPGVAETLQLKAGTGTVKSYTVWTKKAAFRYEITYTSGSNNFNAKFDDAQRVINSVKIA